MPASCIWPESNLCNLKPQRAGGICSITGCCCWTWAGKSLFQRSIVFTVHHGRRCPCTASQSIPSPAKVKLVPHVLVLSMTGRVWRTLRVSLLLLCDTLMRLVHFLGNHSLFWVWCCVIVCCIHMLLFGLFVSNGDIMKNVIIYKSILCSCLVIFPRSVWESVVLHPFLYSHC